MKTSRKLLFTTDYTLFEMHENNRPLHEDPLLEESMKKHGWLASHPMHCVAGKNGKLKIVAGHHRFGIAKKWKIPVCYVIEEKEVTLFELEGSGGGKWTIEDFAAFYAKKGNQHYIGLLKFQKEHGLNFNVAASLYGGESAGSGNKKRYVKTGQFKAGDQTHANQVINVIKAFERSRLEFCKTSAFVTAVSMVLRIPKLDKDWLIYKATDFGADVRHRSRREDYFEELEALYNKKLSGKKRIPIAMLAKQIGRERSDTFGRNKS